ncbi:MAG: class I SAM-dependent rRNA methyltransferase [Planctomycetota bacterium]
MTDRSEETPAAAPSAGDGKPVLPVIQLKAKPAGVARRGRPWLFRDDVEVGEILPPRLVRVLDENQRDLGLGITGDSRLALRMCGPFHSGSGPSHAGGGASHAGGGASHAEAGDHGDAGLGVPDRVAFFRERLEAALEARAGRLGPDDGARLVHGEADWLPGLVVDRFGDGSIVLQVTSAYVEQNLDAIVPLLVERFDPAMVVARNDVPTRRRENLPEGVEILHGSRRAEGSIVEGGVRHTVRPLTGHKTGFYLDQQPARALVRSLAKGRSVLDLFCYQGGFSLHALAGGAASALAVDESESALAAAQADAEANQLQGLTTQQGNVFDVLRELRERNRTFDLIVLDPPAFAKSRRELSGAERGYRDLNRQALRLLAPNGLLVTCTCSHHVDGPRFEEIVRQSAAGLPFRVVVRQRLGAGDDHPALITHPESEYLNVLLLQRR